MIFEKRLTTSSRPEQPLQRLNCVNHANAPVLTPIQTAQSDYMISPRISIDPYHVAVVRTPLTRHLGNRFDDIKDEIASSFSDLVPLKGDGTSCILFPLLIDVNRRIAEWTSVSVYSTNLKIVCRTSNRVFVGLPLCKIKKGWPKVSNNEASLF